MAALRREAVRGLDDGQKGARAIRPRLARYLMNRRIMVNRRWRPCNLPAPRPSERWRRRALFEISSSDRGTRALRGLCPHASWATPVARDRWRSGLTIRRANHGERCTPRLRLYFSDMRIEQNLYHKYLGGTLLANRWARKGTKGGDAMISEIGDFIGDGGLAQQGVKAGPEIVPCQCICYCSGCSSACAGNPDFDANIFVGLGSAGNVGEHSLPS